MIQQRLGRSELRRRDLAHTSSSWKVRGLGLLPSLGEDGIDTEGLGVTPEAMANAAERRGHQREREVSSPRERVNPPCGSRLTATVRARGSITVDLVTVSGSRE